VYVKIAMRVSHSEREWSERCRCSYGWRDTY